ncbi:MAG: serine--tRNA ligase, partial [Anaplasmataceae bacterium]|nr:serine--tRNA ligase [Anaplasmataceae bacterium]
MNCIKYIRNNTNEFIKEMKRRNIDSSKVDNLLEIDLEMREVINKLEFNQKEKNLLNKKINKFDKDSGEYKKIIIQGSKINELIIADNANVNQLKQKVDDLLANFPNVLDISVPNGKSENDNLIIKTEGMPRIFDFPILDHVQLGEKLELIDFNAARKISGSRFSILKNDLAKMQRALINMLLDHNKSYSYQEITHPILISRNAAYNTGQLPKFEDDLFITKDDRVLSPTSEIPLANIHSDETIDIKKLPIRYTSYAECFRAEAGAAGKDTKGIIRQHQFAKVELVSLTTQDQSNDELERMVEIPEKILEKLKLPYRRIL